MNTRCEFDHLVVGADTLEQGAAFIEERLGVRPQAGGAHIAMGTHNVLLRLGARAYLEVIAIDTLAAAPACPRWFGLDSPQTRQRLREEPRLLTWVVRTHDIEAAVAGCPLPLGTIHRMSRGAFAWRITIPRDGKLIADGLLPTVIQWDGGLHPADKLEDRGCEIAELDGAHASPASCAEAIRALGLAATLDVRTDPALEFGGLVARISTRAGIRHLSSGR